MLCLLFIFILNNSCTGDSEVVDYLIFDDSNLPEVPLGLTYQVISPNGEELLEIGQATNITWISTNYDGQNISSGTVKIELYADDIL